MVAIVTRAGKGSPLTNNEVDANFTNLNSAVQPAGGTAGQILAKVDGTDYNSAWIDNYSTALKIKVKNNTGSTINKGAVVYAIGGTGANLLIGLAKADAEATSAQTLGFLDSTLATGGIGFVIFTGTISGIDTSAYADGDPVYLSPTVAGGIVVGVANKPAAPNHLVYLGTVTRSSATVGEIQIRVSNGWELEELHNVSITSPTGEYTQELAYQASTGLWKNYTKTTSTVSEGTNLYYTDARVRAAITGTSPISVNSSTGAVSISLANSTTNGYLSYTDWSTFNGKQAAYTNLTSIGALANTAGWLRNNGTGTFSYSTPTYTDVGAPSATGTGASGTWSISITGSAGSATSATSATTASTANALNTANNYQVNSLGVGTAASGTAGEIRATNNITAYYSSDERFKDNIKNVENPLQIVNAIGSKTFDWTDEYIAAHGGEDGYFVQKSDFGVIAQDVQRVFPQAVRTRQDGTLAVDYEKLSTLAFGAIQQLLKRIEALENR